MKSLVRWFNRHPLLCTFAFVLVCLCPLIAQRDFTYANELRYLSIVDEAISEDRLVTFDNHGVLYADKPPLFFWFMMMLRVLLGVHSIFALTLLALIPAFVTVALMDRWLCKTQTVMPSALSRSAMAMMLLTSGMFLGMSVFVRMDMLMCMFVVLSLYSFYMALRGIGRFEMHYLLMPVWIFLALFSKGPIGFIVPIVAILGFLIHARHPKLLKVYLGRRTWITISILFLIWIIAVYQEEGLDYIQNLLFHQTIDRGVNAFHHKHPIWFYAVNIWPVLMPFALLTVPMFFTRSHGNSAVRLWHTTVVVTFVLCSSFSSKIAIYLLPLVPFLVYLFYPHVMIYGLTKWTRFALYFPSGVLSLAGLAVMAATIIKPSFIPMDFLFCPLVFVAGLLLATGGWLGLYFSNKSWQKTVLSISVSLMLGVFCVGFLTPKLNPWIGYRAVCAKAREMSPDGQVNVLFLLRPENMDVYVGSHPKDYALNIDRFIEDNPSGTLIIKTRYINDALRAHLAGCESAEVTKYTVFKLDR